MHNPWRDQKEQDRGRCDRQYGLLEEQREIKRGVIGELEERAEVVVVYVCGRRPIHRSGFEGNEAGEYIHDDGLDEEVDLRRQIVLKLFII